MAPPRALTIAGSDSGGGAGIQADLKTFQALGVYGISALTAVTAQNTLGVAAVQELSVPIVTAQIEAVLSDIGTDAVKTGMLSSAVIIAGVAEKLREYNVRQLVVDPVMVTRGGDPLLRPEAQDSLKAELLPLARVVTPNHFEAAVLFGEPLPDEAAWREAARQIHALGAQWVVIKGGDEGAEARDLLYDGHSFEILAAPRVPTTHTHGTGCTFSAAIAAYLARGLDVPEAVRRAKAYVTEAIRRAPGLGQGHGPVAHFPATDPL